MGFNPAFKGLTQRSSNFDTRTYHKLQRFAVHCTAPFSNRTVISMLPKVTVHIKMLGYKCRKNNITIHNKKEDRDSTVVKVLCYKSEGRWFDPSWCQWNFSLT